MILRLRRKPGEQHPAQKKKNTAPPLEQKNNNSKRTTTTITNAVTNTPPPKNNRKENNSKQKKVDGITDSPVPQDVIDVLLERFFPAGKALVLNKEKPIVEEEKSDYEEDSDYEEECSTRRARKKPQGKRTQNRQKGNCKMSKKGKKMNENNEVYENDGIDDLFSQPRVSAEDGLDIFIEEEPEIVTLNFRDTSRNAKKVQEKTKRVENRVATSNEQDPEPGIIKLVSSGTKVLGEAPVSNKEKPIVEQEESDYEECSTKRKRKKPQGTENGEKGKSKKPKKGNKTKENNKVHERDGILDSPLQPRQIAEDGLAISIEEEPETVTLNFRDTSTNAKRAEKKTKRVENMDATSNEPDSEPGIIELVSHDVVAIFSEKEPEPGFNKLVVTEEHAYQGGGRRQNAKPLEPSSINSSKRKKGRGIATLSDITDDTSGVRRMVEFNKNGQPTGLGAHKFSSYLGVLGRRMVPIIHESWPRVPIELKEIIWNHLEAKYVLDSKRRKTVLIAIGERWRSFKATLTKFFITPFKDQPELLSRPPEKYNFIQQGHWDAFVRLRISEEFQIKSKLQAQRRAKNKFNHRLGRKGYAGLIEELKQSLGTSVDELDRCFLWKKARQNKKGVYVDDAVREKAEEIDELTKQKEDGNLVIDGAKDVLTLALGTPEHSDRVRGIGHFVTPTAYFHLPKRSSEKYIDELEQRVNQQEDKIVEMNQMVQELQTQFDRNSPQGPPTIASSEKISLNTDHSDSRKNVATPSLENRSCGSQDESWCPNDDHPMHFGFETDCQSMDKGNTESDMSPLNYNSKIGKSKQCRLAVDSKANIVACGMVFEKVASNEKIHTVPLGQSNVRVAVEYAISPNALLPVPVTGEMTVVKDAIGSCVAWPEEFVLTGIQEEEDQDAGEKSGPIQAFASFIDQIMSTNNIIIPMLNVIFGEEVEAHLQKTDLMYLCNMQEITASCIITYTRFLYDNLISYQERYGFVNPASISSARGPDASSIITKRLQTARKDQLFFVPYNTSGRWILIVIDSSSMDVYWMDPLQKPPSMDIKIYVTTGLKALQTDGKRRPNPTWHCVKCPKQPLDVQCGYYVMRYMRELMEESGRPLAEKILQLAKNDTYSQDEVDEVRLELIDFILTHM